MTGRAPSLAEETGRAEPAGSPCSTCPQVVWFAIVEASGRRMILNHGSAGQPGANVAVWPARGAGFLCRVVTKARPLAAGEAAMVPHWATCPDSTRHKRAAPAGGDHQCPGPGCSARVPPEMLACAAHWRQVPASIKRAVYGTWRGGAGAGTAAHTAAMVTAVSRMREIG